jgi:hypothetical protein
MAVIGRPFLFAVGRTDAGIHIEHDGPGRATEVNPVNSLARQIRERLEIGRAGQYPGLEAPHLAA